MESQQIWAIAGFAAILLVFVLLVQPARRKMSASREADGGDGGGVGYAGHCDAGDGCGGDGGEGGD
jgi:hypothetical protein